MDKFREGENMTKEIYWAVAIAVGVFLGALAYEQYTIYRVNQMVQPVFQNMERSMEKARQSSQQAAVQRKQARDLELQQKRKQEIYSNAACGINEDTDTCKCLDIRNGQRINMPKAECVILARQATG